MLNLFKSKPLLDNFYQQNKLDPQLEPFLNIGALLLEFNQKRDSLTLRSRLPSQDLIALLGSAWGLNDSVSCKQLLEELLTLPNQTQQADYINAILLQRCNVNPLAYGVLVSPGKLFTCLEKNCQTIFTGQDHPFDRIRFDAIGNVTAWDLERAGLVCRYGYNISWLTKEETIAYLKRLYKLASNYYDNWADYYIAYMKARTLFYEEQETEYIDYVYTLRDLYSNAAYFCCKYPIQNF
ncbi:hypothetical protein GCM10027566_18540 [Arachidicoccus ginsenosidivorans]|jgi:hypothetical protein|uniref:DUF1266 domain-containing protein n=1 Tax=Arachidicoccus ginsenosidivorans TaxID=496057 RepID=A0A5B8VI12_9BACT|nr:DUF1266 domain-containing protein [Arachidicoccus ginsenosidivorans]QEC70691.1 DUF1266 domain-containing protein [Arachidicoccus ginsenosidivorans]